jgi:hypothetical protein
MSSTPPIETERLRLRPVESGDLSLRRVCPAMGDKPAYHSQPQLAATVSDWREP